MIDSGLYIHQRGDLRAVLSQVNEEHQMKVTASGTQKLDYMDIG